MAVQVGMIFSFEARGNIDACVETMILARIVPTPGY